MGHPYREAFYGAGELPSVDDLPRDLRAAIAALKGLEDDLFRMTIDRDGWQKEAETLRDVVIDRDREIDLLKRVLRDA